jgi:hypothetical protein
MRIGPGHLFGLTENEGEGPASFGEMVDATEPPAIGARGDQDAEVAAQRLVATTIQMHGRKKSKTKSGNPPGAGHQGFHS